MDKIVREHRGGFCYELNSAFGWLLRQLGFDVERLSARMNTITPEVFGPPFDHLCLRVNATWLCDVTASYAMGPLELRTIGRQPQRSHGVLYRFEEYESGEVVARPSSALTDGDEPARRDTGELMLLKHNYLDGWLQTYIVDLRQRRLPEFNDMCLHHQSSPRTQFTKGRFCTIATVDIWMALRKVGEAFPSEHRERETQFLHHSAARAAPQLDLL